MKIVLLAVNCSFSHTNLAIRCIRNPLEQAGFCVHLIEKNIKDRTDHMLWELVEQNADVYGFSCYIWNVELMLTLAENLKKILPQCKIVFGGPEVSFETERFDQYRFIDTIICGEGEEVWPRLASTIQNGQQIERIIRAEPNCHAMKDEGILYRAGDYPSGSMLYYESSRGCPFSCAYCLSSAEEGVRFKSVMQTLSDLESFETLPDSIKIIKFIDRTFNASPKRANAIWKALLSDTYTKHYHFEVCADLLDEESFVILEQFPKGKIQLEFGLQSTNRPTLEAVSRHTDSDKILKATQRIMSFGNIHVHLDLIAGLPFENLALFAHSFDEAYPHCNQLQLGFLKLLPGTILRKNAEKWGIVYESKPPYMVLKTNDLAFRDLVVLHNVSDILERYHNSDRFSECLKVALSCCSPFSFYVGLSEYIEQNDGRKIQSVSQNDAYKLLYQYVSSLNIPIETKGLFTLKMHEDYQKSEVGRTPFFLR